MNLGQFKRWASSSLGPERKEGARLLGSIADVLDRSVDPAFTEYGPFEISLNSREGEGLLKLAHLHFYSAALRESRRAELDESKMQAVLAIGRVVAERFGPGWDAVLFERVLRELRSRGSIGTMPLFGCEYDARLRRVLKLTLYGFLGAGGELDSLTRLLGFKSSRELERAVGRDLDCVGIDFRPGRAPVLKVYNRYAFDAGRIADDRLRRICEEVASLHPVLHLMFLRRLDSRGVVHAPSKVILRLERGIPGEAVASVRPLRPYRSFLARVTPILRGQTVYHVCFEGGGIEVYARKTAAPWI